MARRVISRGQLFYMYWSSPTTLIKSVDLITVINVQGRWQMPTENNVGFSEPPGLDGVVQYTIFVI